ncbi:MAG TPA: hypothetical protein VGL06_10010, partial [Pseudonocardiaceae bacterium]
MTHAIDCVPHAIASFDAAEVRAELDEVLDRVFAAAGCSRPEVPAGLARPGLPAMAGVGGRTGRTGRVGFPVGRARAHRAVASAGGVVMKLCMPHAI